MEGTTSKKTQPRSLRERKLLGLRTPDAHRVTLRTALLTLGYTEDYECTRFWGKSNLIAEHKPDGVVPLKTNDPRLYEYLKNMSRAADQMKIETKTRHKEWHTQRPLPQQV